MCACMCVCVLNVFVLEGGVYSAGCSQPLCRERAASAGVWGVGGTLVGVCGRRPCCTQGVKGVMK